MFACATGARPHHQHPHPADRRDCCTTRPLPPTICASGNLGVARSGRAGTAARTALPNHPTPGQPCSALAADRFSARHERRRTDAADDTRGRGWLV